MDGRSLSHGRRGVGVMGATHGETRPRLCLSVLRRGKQQVAGQMSLLRRLEQPVPGRKRALCPGRGWPQGETESESRHDREPRGRGPRGRRIASGIGELDRAVGDGFTRGCAVLLSGEPGIGKSTLLLQAAAAIAAQGHSALYFRRGGHGQIRLRASRLGLSKVPLGLVAETCVERILATASKEPCPISWSSIRSRRCGPSDQVRARHREPGSSQHAVAHRARKSPGAGDRRRGPCHEGRPDRGTEGDRAYGGCSPGLRRR